MDMEYFANMARISKLDFYLKFLAVWTVIGFVGYQLYTNPTRVGETIGSFGGSVVNGFSETTK